MAAPAPFLFQSPLPVTLAGSVATIPAHNPAVTGLVLIKAGATGVYGGFLSNPSTTAMAYLQCFDASTVSAVTLGTTSPVDVFHIPSQSAFGDKWGYSLPYNNGLVVAATTDVNNATVVTTAVKISLYIS